MQQIDFHFNVAQRTIYASRLIKKVRKMGLTVAVWSGKRCCCGAPMTICGALRI